MEKIKVELISANASGTQTLALCGGGGGGGGNAQKKKGGERSG